MRIAQILGVAIVAYLAYAFYRSKQVAHLVLPFIAEGPESVDWMIKPEALADGLHESLVANKGFRAALHPATLAERDTLFNQANKKTNEELAAVVNVWNKKYRGDGSLVNLITASVSDPFDLDHSKSRLLSRLRALPVK